MKRHLFPILFSFLVAIIVLGSPSETQFLNRLRQDYGTIHGVPISKSVLEEVGKSNYYSYVLWSEYEYSFGTINVSYIGIAFMTFHTGSNVEAQPNNQSKQYLSIL